MLPPTEEDIKSFKHLQVLAILPGSRIYPRKGENFTDTYDKNFEEFSHLVDTTIIKENATYHKVRATDKGMKHEISTLDREAICPDFNDPILVHTMNIMRSHLAPVLSTSVTPDRDYVYHPSTSPGIMFKRNKIKTKQQALESELFKRTVLSTSHVPLSGFNDKLEFLPEEDLANNKLRGTAGTGIDLLAKQKLFFDAQNENIVKNCDNSWIKYGFTKQYGGFHRLLSRFEPFTAKMMSDVSKWDKSIFLLLVYMLRIEFLNFPEPLTELLIYTVFFSIFNVLVLPDGRVVLRKTGNNSGQNSTASDNSIMHMIIGVYLFVYIYFKKFGEFLSAKKLFENVDMALYSDDKLGAFMHEFFDINVDEYIKFETEVYGKFGLVVKPRSFKITIGKGPLDPNFEFLGSLAHFDEFYQRYLPVPRYGKICSSILYEPIHKLDGFETFMRAHTLTLTSAPNEKIFTVLKQYCEFLFNKFKRDRTKILDALHTLKLNHVLTYEEFAGLYLGHESKMPECEKVALLRFTPKEKRWNARIFVKKFSFLTSICFKWVPAGFIWVLKHYMANITRSERLLQRLVGEKVLTQAGKDWLVAVVDPFHDTQLKDLQGWPDVETSASVVRCMKSNMQISATSGGAPAPAGNWDVEIALMPWLSSCPFYKSSARTGSSAAYSSAVASSSAAFGGVVAQACNTFTSGSGFTWPPSSGSTTLLGQLTPDAQSISGMGRVIGIGFEVTDTTASLYQQGSCIVFRQPQYPKESQTFRLQQLDGTFLQTTFDGTEVRMPPASSSAAILFPGSRQWAAKEGCYIVGAFHSNENPPFDVNYNQPVLVPASFDEQIGVMPTQEIWFPTPADSGIQILSNTGVANGKLGTGQPLHLNPIHSCGALFMGLHPNASLSVTLNVYYESFPSIADSRTLVLATPSAEFDPMALNIYSHAIGTMPVGVMVKENGFGDWFRGVVEQIGNVASWIPHPIAQGVASAAKGGIKLIDGFTAPPSTVVHRKSVLPVNAPANTIAGKKLKKKAKKKNAQLAAGNRGKKGNIQGPMRA